MRVPNVDTLADLIDRLIVEVNDYLAELEDMT